MRFRLVAVNYKKNIKLKERVSMIWHYFLWVLHVDGVYIATKRNFLYGVVLLCFLIVYDDVKEPHLLTYEQSDFSNALLCYMQHEFAVKNILVILRKLLRM